LAKKSNRRADAVLIASDRVYLRHPCEEDCPSFLKAVKASRQLHKPWMKPPHTKVRFQMWLERSRLANHFTVFACSARDDQIVGVFALSEIVMGPFRSAYLSYFAVQEFSRQGYMTEGLHLLLRHAFGKLGLHRIEANIQPGNAPSIALAKRCGFLLEGYSPNYLKISGRWRDHERWAIRKEIWRPSRG
jgi:ribosomal-protein-alanine N-acetyltransferase